MSRRAAGRALLTLFTLLLIVEHLVRGDLDPRSHVISEYANGPHGWVMRLGFGLWAASLLVTATGTTGLRRALIGLAALGAALAGAFSTQAVAARTPAGRPATTSGDLHNIGGDLLLVGLVGALISTVLLRGAGQRLRMTAFALGGTAASVDAALLLGGDPVPGLRQRLVLAAALAWQAVLLGGRPPSAQRRS